MTDKQESEATAFAMELLMPPELVKQELAKMRKSRTGFDICRASANHAQASRAFVRGLGHGIGGHDVELFGLSCYQQGCLGDASEALCIALLRFNGIEVEA